MNKTSMWKPALIGGVALGILSAIPRIGMLNCVCCAWVVAGGFLAAYVYIKDSILPVSLGRGAALGLLTGLVGSVTCSLFSAPIYMMTGGSSVNFSEELRRRMETMPNLPQESRQIMESLASNGSLAIFFLIIGFIISVVFFSLFAMLGSTIGVALLEKRRLEPAAAAQEPPSYTPPPPVDAPPPPPPPPPPAE